MTNAKRRGYVRALQRRRDFLANRITNYNRNGNPSHDRAECGAISWALQVILAAQAENVLVDLERVVLNTGMEYDRG